MKNPEQNLVLVKGGEIFVFCYRYGDEEEIICAFSEWAQNNQISFDLLDAVVLGFRLTALSVDQANEFSKFCL